MGADEGRVCLFHVLVGDFQLGRLIATQVIHHAVSALGQATHDFLPFGLLEIKRQAAFALVQRLKKLAVIFAKQVRSDVARRVALSVGIFDLNNVSTHRREMAGAERPRAIMLDRDDAHPFERTVHG